MPLAADTIARIPHTARAAADGQAFSNDSQSHPMLLRDVCFPRQFGMRSRERVCGRLGLSRIPRSEHERGACENQTVPHSDGHRRRIPHHGHDGRVRDGRQHKTRRRRVHVVTEHDELHDRHTVQIYERVAKLRVALESCRGRNSRNRTKELSLIAALRRNIPLMFQTDGCIDSLNAALRTRIRSNSLVARVHYVSDASYSSSRILQ